MDSDMYPLPRRWERRVRLLLDPGGSMVAPRAIGHISQQDTFAIVVLV